MLKLVGDLLPERNAAAAVLDDDIREIRVRHLEAEIRLVVSVEAHRLFEGHLGEAARRIKLVEIDPKYYRPAEVDCLLGDASKARQKLGWQPKTKFKELVRLMVNADMEAAQRNVHTNSYGGAISNSKRPIAG